MFYLSYATGFLSGGFSETCATPSRCAYDPETNENIELGYKADLLDNTLRFNAALYYTKYDDLQRAVVATYTAADGTTQQETVTVNTGSSKATGVDLEATWVPTELLAHRCVGQLARPGVRQRLVPAEPARRQPGPDLLRHRPDAVRPAVLAGVEGRARRRA